MSIEAVIPKAARQADEQADAELANLEQAMEESAGRPLVLDQIGEQTVTDPDPEPGVSSTETLEGSPGHIEDSTPVDLAGDEEEEDTFKQKYLTLQGMYKAQLARAKEEARAETMQQMQVVQQMTAQNAPAVSAAPQGPAYRKYLKDPEVEEFGEEVLEMQSRMAKGVAEEAARVVSIPLMRRIEALESSQQHSSGKSFWASVEQHYPGAEGLNDSGDPLWLAFLDQRDPLSGMTYRDIGESAIASGDVGRVVSLMQLYSGNSSAAVETPDTNGKAPVATPPVKPKRTKGTPAPKSKPEAPLLRESEIKQFYDDVNRGKYRGREAEMKAKEDAIDRATDARTIIPG